MKKNRLLLGVLALFVLFGVAIQLASYKSRPSEPSEALMPTPMVDEKWITDASKRYYDSHISMHWEKDQFYGGVLTPGIANKLMRDCIDTLKNKEKCEEVVNKKFWIGMIDVWATMSVGNPDKINKTVTSGLTREQWVYGNPIYNATYLYFDNGVLTSYQN